MRRLVKFTGYAALLGLIMAAATWIAWQLWPPVLEPDRPFERLEVRLPAYEWYDAGVVDANADGNLDLLTINHSHVQGLFLGDGAGGFEESLAMLGLSQDEAFPGVEDSQEMPHPLTEGVHLFWYQGFLVLDAVGGIASVSGHLQLPGDVSIRTTGGAGAAVRNEGNGISRVDFDIDHRGTVYLRLQVTSVPVRVTLVPETDLTRIFVGRLQIQPASHDFTIRLRDRHGAAWADLNEDGVPDAYITRGGMNGQMASMPGTYYDEFLLSSYDGSYIDHVSEAGFEKRSCPGRQVAWVDYNGDGRLDLYVVCGRRRGAFPNQLYEQYPDLRFRDVAARRGLDLPDLGTFAWLDVEQDGDPDLLWAGMDGVRLYINEPSGFRPLKLRGRSLALVHKIACGDFDADGDIDAFLASAMSNILLVNRDGTFVSEPPAALGLPARSKTATWLDYDSDGLMDFYAWPQGVHIQKPDGHFEATGIARVTSPFWWLVNATVIWFDADTDGDQDLAVFQRFVPRLLQRALPAALPFSANLYRNNGTVENHWLEIDLVGPAGNTPAIGATAAISRPRGNAQVQQVGQFDGAHYSQGHYRLYFGLGNADAVDRLTVRWPDGSTSVLTDLPVNRLLQIGIDSSVKAYPVSGAPEPAMMPGSLQSGGIPDPTGPGS